MGQSTFTLLIAATATAVARAEALLVQVERAERELMAANEEARQTIARCRLARELRGMSLRW
jgi:hypothetical protein